FFFFQAEDGIRDLIVTGVQTCALPILARLSFQDLILRLQNFWAERGCMIETPLDLEVGAGTMHPATFLRVLGPEPWKVGYVQPRSEERRVGKECRCRGCADADKK